MSRLSQLVRAGREEAESPRETLISVSNLRRTFAIGGGSVEALAGLTFGVLAGTYVAITGPSGSGKSTLLNLIGGLDRPTSGTILVNGQDLATMSSGALARFRRRTVGFVFQTFRLLPDLSALENVELPALLDHRGATEPRARLLLERVGLGDRMRHRPSQLSAGEQQRVALARALVNRPRVLLADEPTASLDADAALSLLALLAELQREADLTIVYATHDPTLAAGADRVLRLRHGRSIG